jgi:hypothetical protein
MTDYLRFGTIEMNAKSALTNVNKYDASTGIVRQPDDSFTP